MSENDNLNLVYKQNQSLALPLHYNTHRTERFDHESLFLCPFFMFSTYHGRYYLLSVPSPVFQITEIRFHSKPFHIETPILLPQRH